MNAVVSRLGTPTICSTRSNSEAPIEPVWASAVAAAVRSAARRSLAILRGEAEGGREDPRLVLSTRVLRIQAVSRELFRINDGVFAARQLHGDRRRRSVVLVEQATGFLRLRVGAEEGIRTPTILLSPAPQAGASASSATSAKRTDEIIQPRRLVRLL